MLELISGQPAVVTDSGGVYLEGESKGAAAHVRLEVASAGWANNEDLVDIVKSELPASLTRCWMLKLNRPMRRSATACCRA